MATRRRALEFEGQPIPHTHRLPHPKFLIGTAAVLALLGAYALSRGGESSPPVIDNAPVSDSYKPPEPPKQPELPVVAAPLQPTEVAPPLKTEPKPLPEVINNTTVRFVSLPEAEILTLLNQQKEPKIPMPDIPSGLSIKEIKSKTGHSMLAIYGQATNLDLPVLLEGEVIQVLAGRSATYDGIVIKTKDGKLWGYVVPSPARSKLREHDPVKLNQTAISLNYTPGSLDTEDWRRYVQKQYTDAPSDTVAVITGLNPNGVTVTDILRTQEGTIVTTGTVGK